MKWVLIVWCMLSTAAFAQQYQPQDSMAPANVALQQLPTPKKVQQPSEPQLLCFKAQQKLQLQQYDSSIYFCNQAIALLAKQPDNKLLVAALHCKGNAQYYLDDHKKAETNWRQALTLALKENEYDAITKIASNLGAVYLDDEYLHRSSMARFATADSFFAIAYAQLQSKDSLASAQGLRTLRLMATSLHLQKKYDSADHYYKKVISLSKTVNVNTYLGALTFYAELLSETGRYQEALHYAKEALAWASHPDIKTKDQTHIMHVYGRTLYNSGNFKEAYKFNDSSYRLLIKDYEKINATAYSESESKFKNQLLQYQVELERAQKNKSYLLLAGILLLSVIILLWVHGNNNKRIAREKATQKQVSIDAFIEGEEKEKLRIGRELHDGIAQEVVAIKLAMQQQHTDSKLVEELTRISTDIRNISHELMPQTLKAYGLSLAIEDVCAKILAPSGIRYQVEASLPQQRLANKIEITLYRIFQELVHNIIKHSKATEVLVQLKKINNHIVLLVEDNGQGMPTKNSNGIGISNIKSRVQLVDGNLQIDSSATEGTTAIVRVPVGEVAG